MLLSHFEVKEWDVGAVNNDGTSPLHYLARRQVPDHQKALYEETLAKTADKGLWVLFGFHVFCCIIVCLFLVLYLSPPYQ